MENLDSILNFVLIVLGAIVALFLTGLGTERVTEAIKVVLGLLSGWLHKIPSVGDITSHPIFKWVLSAFVAWAITQGLSLDMLLQLDLFSGLDPALINLLSQVLVWVTSNYLHTRLKDKLPGVHALVTPLRMKG